MGDEVLGKVLGKVRQRAHTTVLSQGPDLYRIWGLVLLRRLPCLPWKPTPAIVRLLAGTFLAFLSQARDMVAGKHTVPGTQLHRLLGQSV